MMVRAVAYWPDQPRVNPRRDVSLDSKPRGRLIRLECPEELGGRWDGPIYVLLQGSPKNLLPNDPCEFLPLGRTTRIPGWECKLVFVRPGQDVSAIPEELRQRVDEIVWILLWRLTHIHRDLIAETDERPLLTVFRFVRFARFFAMSSDDHSKFVLEEPVRWFCGQVLTYRLVTSISLVDRDGIIIEPGSAYICVVAIRRHVSERHLVVAIPLPDVLEHLIPSEEFTVGFAHGQLVARRLASFATGWEAFRTARLSTLQEAHGSSFQFPSFNRRADSR